MPADRITVRNDSLISGPSTRRAAGERTRPGRCGIVRPADLPPCARRLDGLDIRCPWWLFRFPAVLKTDGVRARPVVSSRSLHAVGLNRELSSYCALLELRYGFLGDVGLPGNVDSNYPTSLPPIVTSLPSYSDAT